MRWFGGRAAEAATTNHSFIVASSDSRNSCNAEWPENVLDWRLLLLRLASLKPEMAESRGFFAMISDIRWRRFIEGVISASCVVGDPISDSGDSGVSS